MRRKRSLARKLIFGTCVLAATGMTLPQEGVAERRPVEFGIEGAASVTRVDTRSGPAATDIQTRYTAIIPNRSGRRWVLREGEGRPVDGWTEPEGWERNPAWVPERRFEVFGETTGRCLGRVDVPQGFSSEPEPVIQGDAFICLTSDDVGCPIVRRTMDDGRPMMQTSRCSSRRHIW